MDREKSRLKIGLEWSGLIGGIATILMLLGGAASVLSEFIKVQAQHETRLDILERGNMERITQDNRFQDQIKEQLNRIQDDNKQTYQDLRVQIDKIHDLVKGGEK